MREISSFSRGVSKPGTKRVRVDNRDRRGRRQLRQRGRDGRDRSARVQYLTTVQSWDVENPCPYCGFWYLNSHKPKDRDKCCKRGGELAHQDEYSEFEKFRPYPDNISALILSDVKHFSSNSAIYNRSLSIADTFIDNGRGGKVERINGSSSVTINGSVKYYMQFDALKGSGGLSFFTFDGLDRSMQHANQLNGAQSAAVTRIKGPRINLSYMTAIFQGLQHDNPFCSELRQTGDKIVRVQPDGQQVVELTQEMIASINNSNNFFEVAAFSADNARSNVSFRYNLNGQIKTLNAYNPLVEPLVYPILFWYGERGYSQSMNKSTATYYEYMRARMLMPESGWENSFVFEGPGSALPCKQPVSRCQVLSRVSQYFAVEGVSRAQDYRMNWHRGVGKATIFGRKLSGGMEALPPVGTFDADREEFNDANKSFLAESFTGSPRHLKALARNAMVICSELGSPTVFITVTCNAKDPAISSRLLPGQTAFDRPEIVTMVWKAQIKAFLANLRAGKYFGGTPVYLMNVIEYQHRGLPHMHCVTKINGVPEDECGKLHWISQHIQARYPVPGTDSVYAELIKTHMVHNCSNAVNGCLDKNGVCKRGYNNTVINVADSFTTKGFPVYARHCVGDLKVVPHNRQILTDLPSHINVEFCGMTYCILYLYKYLFKGNAKVTMNLNNTSDVDEHDEIKLAQRGRMLCAMQAWWQIWEYQSYPATQPSCKIIKAKLPDVVDSLLLDGKVCDMGMYFARPACEQLNNLTFTQFFAKYDYKVSPPAYATRTDAKPTFTVTISGKIYTLYETQETHIVRMGMVPLTAGEIYWLRLLLYNMPANTYTELKIVGGKEAKTFQEAARLRKYMKDATVAQEMFEECILTSTPHQLRCTFTTMTLEGFPTLHLFTNPTICATMTSDLHISSNTIKNNTLLHKLAHLFKQHNKHLSEFGLPEPKDQDSELQLELLRYESEEQKSLANSLLAAHPLTEEMHFLFSDICAAIESKKTFIGILQGAAGTGKSTFVKYVMAYVRSLGYVAKGCASTGLAAAVYDDFSTAHSLFCIPVIEDEEDYDQEGDLQCRLHLQKYSGHKEMLEAMKFCAWDEISSQHMRDIRAALSAMNKFTGKILLFIGDGKQITPVVKGAPKSAICAASIYCSELRTQAKFYRFTTILRLINVREDPHQAQYGRLLEALATNSLSLADEPSFHIVDDSHCNEGVLRLHIPHLNPLFSTAEVLKFAHPDGFDPSTVHNSCILAVTNDQVEEWNAKVQTLNPNAEYILQSKDFIGECDDPHGVLEKMVTEEVMHKFTDPSKSPPHKLHLKLNDICILMRAVNKDDKFATNTRVRVVGISPNIVRVSTLEDNPRFCNLPRFYFVLKLPYGKSFEMTRRQFPLRLAYSLTMNRAQGQTLDRVVVDLRRHAFMHGHLMVAMSRIRNCNNIAVFILHSDFDSANNTIITTNCVYPEIIAALNG